MATIGKGRKTAGLPQTGRPPFGKAAHAWLFYGPRKTRPGRGRARRCAGWPLSSTGLAHGTHPTPKGAPVETRARRDPQRACRGIRRPSDLGRNGSYRLLTGLVGDDDEPLAKFLGGSALIVGTGGPVSGLLGRFFERTPDAKDRKNPSVKLISPYFTSTSIVTECPFRGSEGSSLVRS